MADNENEIDAPDVKALIDKAVAEATAGLTKNRDEILNEKRQLAERVKLLDSLGGEDGIKELMQLKERFGQDEESRLIKEGKIDEVINRRIKAQTDRYVKQTEQLNADLDLARKQATDFQNRYRRSVLDNEVARQVYGLQDGALDLVQQIAHSLLQVSDEGKIIPREEAQIWRNGKPVEADSLRDYILETRSYLFRPSQGGGANPTSGTSKDGKRLNRERFEELSHPERRKFMQAGGIVVD